MPRPPKPIVLTVLDGWGYRPEISGNAIALASKPAYDALLKKFPNTLVRTSGPAVGLPEDQMGNSEVGHMNIGAGRVVHMDITRIDLMIQSGEFFSQPLLREAMGRGRQQQLHLLGLLSDGGVHSQLDHLLALLRMARENHVERVFVHAFMDGRDTPPNSGVEYVRSLEQKLREYGAGRMATLCGAATSAAPPTSLSSRWSSPKARAARRAAPSATTTQSSASISEPTAPGR